MARIGCASVGITRQFRDAPDRRTTGGSADVGSGRAGASVREIGDRDRRVAVHELVNPLRRRGSPFVAKSAAMDPNECAARPCSTRRGAVTSRSNGRSVGASRSPGTARLESPNATPAAHGISSRVTRFVMGSAEGFGSTLRRVRSIWHSFPFRGGLPVGPDERPNLPLDRLSTHNSEERCPAIGRRDHVRGFCRRVRVDQGRTYPMA